MYVRPAHGSRRTWVGWLLHEEGDHMTSKAAFTDEEWERVRRAPFVAGMAITIADPGGPIEISKEGMATIRAATVPPSQDELRAVDAIVAAKSTPEETEAFRGWLVATAQAAADAAKEGGFMGFGAVQVS